MPVTTPPSVEALAPVKHQLCPDNQRRAETNPLRVLDSKDEARPGHHQHPAQRSPTISAPSPATHFAQVLAALDACSRRPTTINPRLVRGLDYYTRTTFEFTVTTGLGTQNALLGGGRYDGLSEMLGGPRAPGIGFAIGEDRLILTLQAQADADAATDLSSRPERSEVERPASPAATPPLWAPKKLDAYIAPLGPAQNPAALALAHDLRHEGLTVEVGDGTFKIGKAFGIADHLARHIVILGEDEASSASYTVKTFSSGEQSKLSAPDLIARLRT